MKFTSAAALALAVAPALAIPPADFGLPEAPNDQQLSVAFRQDNATTRDYVPVSPGALFGSGITTHRPALGINTTQYSALANYSGDYVVLMVDPDAPTPENASSRFILHYMQANFTQSTNVTVNANLSLTGRHLINNTAPLVPYMQPRPGVNSSAHRYIIYAFQQPANFAIPANWSGLNANNRTRFNLTNFIRDTRLGTPAAANYFFVSNQTNVPVNYTANPGGSYPGGNGLAITSGTAAPSVSATGPATGSNPPASATAGSSSTSSSRAGAAMVTGFSGLMGAGLVGLAALL